MTGGGPASAALGGVGFRPPGHRPGGVKSSGLKRREAVAGLLFVLPALAAFTVLILYPFVQSLWMAFNEFTLMTPEPAFVGLANFRTIIEDGRIAGTLAVTAMFVALATTATVGFGLTWALILNQRFSGVALLRSISLVPWVLPSVVTASIWAWILNGNFGLLNALLLTLGVIRQPIVWLADGTGAMLAVVAAKTWASVPVAMLFFLAALQSVEREQVEAARLDGANNLRLVRHVVIPHIRPTVIVVVVLQAMGNLQTFDVIYALTGGGPVRATTVLSIEVYRQAFQNWDTGIACAIGVIWLLTIAPLALAYLRRLFRS
jgi:multiple sugar transport system permease protein